MKKLRGCGGFKLCEFRTSFLEIHLVHNRRIVYRIRDQRQKYTLMKLACISVFGLLSFEEYCQLYVQPALMLKYHVLWVQNVFVHF